MTKTIPAIGAFLFIATCGACSGARYLTAEPPRGTLAAGQTVLVDDGSCPAGQVKEVTGGSNFASRQGNGAGADRTTRCVPR